MEGRSEQKRSSTFSWENYAINYFKSIIYHNHDDERNEKLARLALSLKKYPKIIQILEIPKVFDSILEHWCEEDLNYLDTWTQLDYLEACFLGSLYRYMRYFQKVSVYEIYELSHDLMKERLSIEIFYVEYISYLKLLEQLGVVNPAKNTAECLKFISSKYNTINLSDLPHSAILNYFFFEQPLDGINPILTSYHVANLFVKCLLNQTKNTLDSRYTYSDLYGGLIESNILKHNASLTSSLTEFIETWLLSNQENLYFVELMRHRLNKCIGERFIDGNKFIYKYPNAVKVLSDLENLEKHYIALYKNKSIFDFQKIYDLISNTKKEIEKEIKSDYTFYLIINNDMIKIICEDNSPDLDTDIPGLAIYVLHGLLNNFIREYYLTDQIKINYKECDYFFSLEFFDNFYHSSVLNGLRDYMNKNGRMKIRSEKEMQDYLSSLEALATENEMKIRLLFNAAFHDNQSAFSIKQEFPEEMTRNITHFFSRVTHVVSAKTFFNSSRRHNPDILLEKSNQISNRM